MNNEGRNLVVGGVSENNYKRGQIFGKAGGGGWKDSRYEVAFLEVNGSFWRIKG